ncbi:hypothetical protein BRO54_0828 [Geobacillus proteiniphilus]|uniref:Uncharacterized protein n=1 Tax=Geobacillus proteiniphilus TaxID=860353 RepID=A0A1Q5T6N2_9BACL|nr:hypothetical protein BRO54_0828 [Geobacillus proteiniphilus]
MGMDESIDIECHKEGRAMAKKELSSLVVLVKKLLKKPL